MLCYEGDNNQYDFGCTSWLTWVFIMFQWDHVRRWCGKERGWRESSVCLFLLAGHVNSYVWGVGRPVPPLSRFRVLLARVPIREMLSWEEPADDKEKCNKLRGCLVGNASVTPCILCSLLVSLNSISTGGIKKQEALQQYIQWCAYINWKAV
jgi:hypothetical protein